mgnify:CR=1 FL=1
MPKAIPIDPVEMRKPSVLRSKEIMINAYVPDPEAEARLYGTPNLVRIYRDMAVISLPLIVLVPLGLWLLGVGPGALWFGVALFVVQYLLAAISARHSGIRFVTNVLAIHSAKKITAPKPAAA